MLEELFHLLFVLFSIVSGFLLVQIVRAKGFPRRKSGRLERAIADCFCREVAPKRN
jgi:hypothetical protein